MYAHNATIKEESIKSLGILSKINHAKRATDLSSVIPRSVLKRHLECGGNTKFFLPKCVFKPDQWTSAFLKGLHRFGQDSGFSGNIVVELGTGCCINLVLIKSIFNPREVFGSDIHPDVPKVAETNVEYNLDWKKKLGVHIISGGHNLGKWMSPGFQADVIFGCLPQVVAPIEAKKDFTANTSEASSHYYNKEDYPLASKHSHQWGLGLNEHALRELSPNLKTGGKIILNLGGRPGKQRILSMFRKSGFTPNILHEELIPQHAGTSIETLVEQESNSKDNGHFEFFDRSGKLISATEAHKARCTGNEIFHKIYVVVGTKK